MVEAKIKARCRFGCRAGCRSGCRAKIPKALILRNVINLKAEDIYSEMD